jgi:hypothetical protein
MRDLQLPNTPERRDPGLLLLSRRAGGKPIGRWRLLALAIGIAPRSRFARFLLR